MLTNKEIKLLNLIHFKLKGEHMSTIDLWEFLQEFFRIKYDLAYELAYLYDNNFEEANGDFANVSDPDRESYEEYWDSIDRDIKITMLYTKDKNPRNYDENYGDVEHDGTTYKVYSDINELEEIAVDNADWICDDISEMAERYITMDDFTRREFADESANSYYDDMDDEGIIDMGSIKNKIKELEEQKSELIDLQSELEKLKTNLEEVNTDEERETIEYDIEEVESKIDDIGSEERVDLRIQELIDETREELKSYYANQIYDELENPVEYFLSNGLYRNINHLVNSGPVEFDCESAKEDYFTDADYEMIVNAANYQYWDEIRYEGHDYILVWN